jgi:hypothetical protein
MCLLFLALFAEDREATSVTLPVCRSLTLPAGPGFAGLLGEVFDHVLDGLRIELWQVFGILRNHQGRHGATVVIGELATETLVADASVAFSYQENLIPTDATIAVACQEDLVVNDVSEVFVVARSAHQILHGGGSSVGRTIRALKVKL